jgi:hypothetical protein
LRKNPGAGIDGNLGHRGTHIITYHVSDTRLAGAKKVNHGTIARDGIFQRYETEVFSNTATLAHSTRLQLPSYHTTALHTPHTQAHYPMSPSPAIGAFVCPFIEDSKHYKMTSAIESGTFIYLYNPQRHHTMIYDPEVGTIACECSQQESKSQSVIKKISYCIVVSAAVTTFIASFLAIMSWNHPHTVQQWFENGSLGVVVWSLFIVNVCMCLVLEISYTMLDE